MVDTKDFNVRMLITPIIEQIENISKPLKESIEEGAEGLKKNVKEAAKEYKRLIKEAEESFEGMTKSLGSLRGIGASLTGGIEEVFGGMAKGVASGAGVIAGGVEAIVGMIGAIQPELIIIAGILILILGMLSAIMGPVVDGVMKIVEIISMPFKIFGYMLLSKMGPFFDIAIKVSSILMNFFAAWEAEYQKKYAEYMGENPENPIAATAGASAAAFTQMLIEPILSGFLTIIELLYNGLVDVMAALIWAFVEFLAPLFANIGIDVNVEQLKANLDEAKQKLKDDFAEPLGEVRKHIDLLSDVVGDLVYNEVKELEDAMGLEGLAGGFIKSEEWLNDFQTRSELAAKEVTALGDAAKDAAKALTTTEKEAEEVGSHYKTMVIESKVPAEMEARSRGEDGKLDVSLKANTTATDGLAGALTLLVEVAKYAPPGMMNPLGTRLVGAQYTGG